jgi:hypothetical protein
MESKLARAAPLMFLAAALAFPRVASAQTETIGWTRCTPGAFQSCNSAQLYTTPIYVGGLCVGTDISIDLHNWNGQTSDDNTVWSGLQWVVFYAQDFTNWPTEQEVVPLDLTGGATGSASWQGRAQNEYPANPGWAPFEELSAEGPAGGALGGCTPGIGTSAYTFGVGATATVSFTSVRGYNASDFGGADWGVYGQATGSQDYYSGYCSFGVTGVANGCWIQDLGPITTPVVTPEPTTVTLLVTGLLGIGAARWQGRRRRASIDL